MGTSDSAVLNQQSNYQSLCIDIDVSQSNLIAGELVFQRYLHEIFFANPYISLLSELSVQLLEQNIILSYSSESGSNIFQLNGNATVSSQNVLNAYKSLINVQTVKGDKSSLQQTVSNLKSNQINNLIAISTGMINMNQLDEEIDTLQLLNKSIVILVGDQKPSQYIDILQNSKKIKVLQHQPGNEKEIIHSALAYLGLL
ncbi:Hypothetical_protein [Hexamita inflata]|uniref:Hypothetical_protein n=1 Tax=Hexamita inflata TaxID=28002 RepID=A0AA86PSE1_9EUKA|nr:Hypothetical protein HINF_LOCUS33095 [Hexamita inflata]